MTRFPVALASAVILMSSGTVVAGTLVDINSSNWGDCSGNTSCTIGGATITATGDAAAARNAGFSSSSVATLQAGFYGGDQGLGISFLHSVPADEYGIQYSETMDISFGGIGVVQSLRLIFLYNPEQGGDPQEIALITSNPNGFATTYSLQVLSNAPNDWIWTGQGTVTRDSTDLGLWTITNPFGTELTSFLSLTAPQFPITGPFPGDDRTDYALYALTVTAVPEPNSLVSLVVGILGFGVTALRRRVCQMLVRKVA